MQDFITSYLVQKKECALPLLGNFRITTSPALLDVADKKMRPSKNEIIYTEDATYLTEGLIEYISHLEKITRNEAEEKINNWCLHAKMKLDSGEKILFNSIGSLQKNESGNIFFEKEKQINFFEPVLAERVIHKNDEHAVLVGDKETTSSVMNEFYKEEIIEKKSSWKIWALALAAFSVIVLIFHFSNHSFSSGGIANQSAFPVQQTHAGYTVLK